MASGFYVRVPLVDGDFLCNVLVTCLISFVFLDTTILSRYSKQRLYHQRALHLQILLLPLALARPCGCACLFRLRATVTFRITISKYLFILKDSLIRASSRSFWNVYILF